jgi:hypothetical protein
MINQLGSIAVSRALSCIVFGSLVALGSLGLTSSAYANLVDTVTIGLQEAGFGSPLGSITTVATGLGQASFFGAYGDYSSNSISGFGVSTAAGDLLDSNSINIDKSVAKPTSLTVYVTDSDITTPTGLATFLSTLTTNKLLANITSVAEATYLDPGNGIFTETIPLSSATLPTLTTDALTALASTGGGPYSVTEVYTITPTGTGTANSTIQLAAEVPEPASMALLGSGLLALAAVMRRRRHRAI